MRRRGSLGSIRPEAIIMDLCGTIVDSIGIDMNVMDELGQKYVGLPYSVLDARRDKSKSMRANFPNFFGEDAAPAYEEYVRLLIGNVPQTPLFRDVEPFLKLCHDRQIPVCFLTNRPASYTQAVLARKNIGGYITGAFAAQDDLGVEKPSAQVVEFSLAKIGRGDIAKRNVAFIGDSVVDIVCADNAGCIPLIFANNPPEADKSFIENRLKQTKPRRAHVFYEYAELIRAWEVMPVRHIRSRRQTAKPAPGA